MRLNNYITAAILTILAMLCPVKAHGDAQYISPGIKLGYTFGKGGGFTFGAEVSYIVWYKSAANAVVLGYDICAFDSVKGLSKLHLGYQLSTAFIGGEVGPTIVWQGTKPQFGATLTPFIGLGAYLYYSYTMVLTQQKDIDEWGFLLKYPISVPGHPPRDFSIGD